MAMILDARSTMSPLTGFDLVIVGAGAAGIALAREFDGWPARVLVLEGGGEQDQAALSDHLHTDIAGFGGRSFAESRGWGFGGTTNRWAGQALPLDPSDFQVRPWIPRSGWPFPAGVLHSYIGRAEETLGLPSCDYGEGSWPRNQPRPHDLDRAIARFRYSQFAREPSFSVRHGAQMKSSANITVLVNAPVTRLLFSRGGTSVQGTEVAIDRDRRVVVEGQRVVLACGAVQSTRLLLASTIRYGVELPGGALVGCCFQDHAHIGLPLRPSQRRDAARRWNTRLTGGRRIMPKLVAAPELQEREGMLSIGADVSYIPGARSVISSAKVLVSALRTPSQRSRAPRAALIVARRPHMAIRAVTGRLVYKHKLSEGEGAMVMGLQCETAPRAESTVTLTEQTDALGVPRARVHWHVGKLERRTMTRFAAVLARTLREAGLGEVDARMPHQDDVAGWMSRVNAGHHHVGTLRMARDPSDGVTDPDGRVHGCENLFVAGSATFPTGGFSNPTLTLLALTIRLADRLKRATA